MHVGFAGSISTPCLEIYEYRHPPNHRVPAHTHASEAFVLSLDGGFDWSYRRRLDVTCRRGDLLVVPPAEEHAENVLACGAHSLIVVPRPDWAPTDPGVQELLADRLLLTTPMVRMTALTAAQELVSPDQLTALALESLLLALVASSSRQAATARRGTAGWLRRVRSRLDDEYAASHTLASLAATAGVSRSLLARDFKHAYGVSVGVYLRARRLERAAAALATTRTALSDIAIDTGFYDQSHFTAAFKRTVGVTPHVFRAQRQR